MREDLVCGVHAVLTALREHPERIGGVWVAVERADRRIEGVVQAARTAGVRFHRVPRAKLDDMAEGARHRGVVARVHAAPVKREQDLEARLETLERPALFLVLDGVQDPHNLGACLRVADAAGAHGVILPRDRTAPLSAAARRVASGAAETVAVYQVVNLARALDSLKEAGVWLYGAAQDAKESLYAADLTVPCAVVLGGEGEGLRRLTRERCDRLIRIPMAGKVESLNVSVAAGVVLYEAVRQRAYGTQG
ncbi:MAG TPA: 23S rRNA (guanosine(2251)-2'-O)-methyltransferase RlmB [Burkholderiales bacterium]